jgi:hypothetical protein
MFEIGLNGQHRGPAAPSNSASSTGATNEQAPSVPTWPARPARDSCLGSFAGDIVVGLDGPRTRYGHWPVRHSLCGARTDVRVGSSILHQGHYLACWLRQHRSIDFSQHGEARASTRVATADDIVKPHIPLDRPMISRVDRSVVCAAVRRASPCLWRSPCHVRSCRCIGSLHHLRGAGGAI